MKKISLILGTVLFILAGMAASASADDNAFTKLGRGIANIVLSPGEFYTQPILMEKNHDESVAIFGGIVKGFSVFVTRELVGVFEVLTFPFPVPKGYKPLIEPVTTFADWDARSAKPASAIG